MLIYNVTTKVSHGINEAWLQWMKEEHIPKILATGMFTHHRMVRVLETDDSEGATYAVQYFCNSWEQYADYIKHFAPDLRQKVIERWGDQIVSFRTLMEVIN
jgi:Mn-containing catalase